MLQSAERWARGPREPIARMGLLGGVKIVAKEEVERDLRKEKKRAKKEDGQ